MSPVSSSLRRRGISMRQGRTLRTVLLATSALVPFGLVPAHSNPQGGQVVGGSASISTQGSTTTITQSTDRAVINWNTFNINAGETTRFIQPVLHRTQQTHV